MPGEQAVNWLNRVDPAGAGEAAAVQHYFWTMECAYWKDVDFNAGQNAAEFYCEDAVFDVGLPGARFEGKVAIAKFYAGRRAQGRRTTLHIVNNFILMDWNASLARTHAIVSLIGADGEPPQQVDIAQLLTSAQTEYVNVDGSWKVASRVNVPQFIDGTKRLGDRISGAGR